MGGSLSSVPDEDKIQNRRLESKVSQWSNLVTLHHFDIRVLLLPPSRQSSLWCDTKGCYIFFFDCKSSETPF